MGQFARQMHIIICVIMKNKLYEIKSISDIERVALATLKKTFSPSMLPRVLTNKSFDGLDILSKFTDFRLFETDSSQKFAQSVHSKNFDLGLFFLKIGVKLFLKLFDGTGHRAGQFVTNIFDGLFSLDGKLLSLQKDKILREYDSLNQNKLIVQCVKNDFLKL